MGLSRLQEDVHHEKIGVVLSGCGVYDGTEIHEAVLTLLAIARSGAQAICFAPDKPQADVINHLTGEAMAETRNVLIEAARITRGDIRPVPGSARGAGCAHCAWWFRCGEEPE